jgi:hypothetical protein
MAGVGERCRQLGTLVDRPRRYVVQHVDRVGVVRIPVDRGGAGCDRARRVLFLGGDDLMTAYVTLSGTGRLAAIEWRWPGLALAY